MYYHYLITDTPEYQALPDCSYCRNKVWSGPRLDGQPFVCYSCERKIRKKARKAKRGKPSNPQHSKPLSPGGVSFFPDQMTNLKHWRTIAKDDVDRRQNRKRQRRVNQYFIDLELYELDTP